jgi:hypothetical protein
MEPNDKQPAKRGKKPGSPKTGGRVKGTPNKVGVEVKAALERAFKDIGGHAALARWARNNQTEFYKLWTKLLPKDINATVDGKLHVGGQVTIYLPDNGRDGASEDGTAVQ